MLTGFNRSCTASCLWFPLRDTEDDAVFIRSFFYWRALGCWVTTITPASLHVWANISITGTEIPGRTPALQASWKHKHLLLSQDKQTPNRLFEIDYHRGFKQPASKRKPWDHRSANKPLLIQIAGQASHNRPGVAYCLQISCLVKSITVWLCQASEHVRLASLTQGHHRLTLERSLTSQVLSTYRLNTSSPLSIRVNWKHLSGPNNLTHSLWAASKFHLSGAIYTGLYTTQIEQFGHGERLLVNGRYGGSWWFLLCPRSPFCQGRECWVLGSPPWGGAEFWVLKFSDDSINRNWHLR